jgi:hypothetical protein
MPVNFRWPEFNSTVDEALAKLSVVMLQCDEACRQTA